MLFFWTISQKCDDAICEIAQGSTEALAVVYRAYGKMVLSVGYQITNNQIETEDVLQETMLKILRLAHTYKRGTNPKAWVMTIARNCAIDVVNKRVDNINIDELELAADDFSEHPAEMMLIKDAINKLTPEEKTIINLKLYIGLSHSEIASVLKISVFAVQKKYQRALSKLKKYYEE